MMPSYLWELHLYLEGNLLLSPSREHCLGTSLLHEGKLSNSKIIMGGYRLLVNEHASQAELRDMPRH